MTDPWIAITCSSVLPRKILLPLQTVTSLQFHPTQEILAAGSRDCTVKLFDHSKSAVKKALKTIQVSAVMCTVVLLWGLMLHGNYCQCGTCVFAIPSSLLKTVLHVGVSDLLRKISVCFEFCICGAHLALRCKRLPSEIMIHSNSKNVTCYLGRPCSLLSLKPWHILVQCSGGGGVYPCKVPSNAGPYSSLPSKDMPCLLNSFPSGRC